MTRSHLAAALLLLLASCQPKKEPLPPLGLADGCQPLLAGTDCFGPFPSDYFRTVDASLPSGHRVQLTKPAKIRSDSGLADPLAWRPTDGASLAPTLVTSFPGNLSADGFAGVLSAAEASVSTSAQTLWVAASSGKRIHHFVDLDPRAKPGDKQAVVFHVREGLEENTRYVVAIRGAKAPDGTPAPAPEGFRRIRDGEASGDPQLEPLAARFEADIFPVLEAAGWARKDVQLAWDFTTGTRANVTRDMLRVRELTLAWLSSHEPTVKVTDVEEGGNDLVWRTVRGTVESPLFMVQDVPGADLFRGADGQVAQNGTTTFHFTAVLPKTVRDATGEVGPLLYGHGFFGEEDEVTYGSSVEFASRLKVPTFGIRWVGMSLDDAGTVAGALLGDPTNTLQFTDRLHQAMANWLVMSRAVEGPLHGLPAFARTGGDPAVAADGSRFLGISQGHILGGTMNALNPRSRRIILNVGGASFTTMMMRAHPFAQFLLLLESNVRDAYEQQKLIAALQPGFDRVDPASYAHLLLSQPLPGSPADRRVLMQAGLGDTAVPNAGSFLHAQLVGLKQLQPAPAAVPLLSPVDGPVEGSAYALYDFGVDLAAIYSKAQPSDVDTGVHENMRKTESVLAQMDRFLTDGVIESFCSGVCDPQ